MTITEDNRCASWHKAQRTVSLDLEYSALVTRNADHNERRNQSRIRNPVRKEGGIISAVPLSPRKADLRTERPTDRSKVPTGTLGLRIVLRREARFNSSLECEVCGWCFLCLRKPEPLAPDGRLERNERHRQGCMSEKSERMRSRRLIARVVYHETLFLICGTTFFLLLSFRGLVRIPLFFGRWFVLSSGNFMGGEVVLCFDF
jgi:hypothetical protein